MSIPNVTVISTKILLRNDVLSNWQVSTIVLEQGEPAIEFDPTTLTSKIKIGDGKHTFAELPYSTMTPNEIRELVASQSGGGSSGEGSINSVELTSGTNDGTLKLTVNGVVYDNIAVTGLGSAAFTDAHDYATAEQGVRAENAMLFKGFTTSLPVVDVSTGDTYSVTTKLTIPAALSATNEDVTVNAGAIITLTNEGKWAALTFNSFESMDDIKISIDNLVPGNNTIVFNGGSASM